MRADRRLYVDKDWTRLVPEGSAEAAFLLNAPGQEIEAELVKRLGLVEVDGRVMQGVELRRPESPSDADSTAPLAPPTPDAVVSPEPLADVVQPAGKMEEPKAKAPRAPKKSKE